MLSVKLQKILFFIALILGIAIWAIWVIRTHPTHAIVSWDEGFHGGAALFISEILRNNFSFSNYTYILNDFMNGMIWYPPLWLFIAGPLGVLFYPSVEVYRFATLIFAIFSILNIALFVKYVGGFKAGLITGATLMFAPVFIVYSHLMMREVPLLFSVSITIIFFYKFLTKEKLRKADYLLTLIAFVVGVLAKIVGIALIFGTILTFGLLLCLFFRTSREWQRFYSKWTIYFLITSVISFLSYRHFTKAFLKADPLLFHINQTKELSGERSDLLISLAKTLNENLTFYLRDFSHMPALTFFWFGSLIAYFILKRSLLSLLLIVWTLVTYLIFSIVKPQAPQYILSIFVPLSIAVGLFWGEFLNYRNIVIRNSLLVVIMIIIIYLGVTNLDRTETIVWRNTITFQNEAANFVAENANSGDRVITTGDGTRFLVRLAGFKKKLQTINGAAPNCSIFIQDSIEWAISDNGPQSPIKIDELRKPNWVALAKFKDSLDETTVLKNSNRTDYIEDTSLFSTKCVRILSLGKNEINIFATSLISSNFLSENLKIYLKVNPLKTLKDLEIKSEDLKKGQGLEQKYSLIIDQTRPNQPVYFLFDIPKDLQFKISKIEIKK